MVTNDRQFVSEVHGTSDPILMFNEEKSWNMTIPTIRQALYLVVQLLERRDEYFDKDDQEEAITREYLDKVYRQTAYAVIKLNDEGNRSKLKYGQYSLDLARPPIFLDDYENQEKIHIQVKISVVRAGGGIDMANPNADSDLLKKKSPSEKYYDPNFYKARSGSEVGSGKGREEG